MCVCVCMRARIRSTVILTSSQAPNYCTTAGAAGKDPLNFHPGFTLFNEGGKWVEIDKWMQMKGRRLEERRMSGWMQFKRDISECHVFWGFWEKTKHNVREDTEERHRLILK